MDKNDRKNSSISEKSSRSFILNILSGFLFGYDNAEKNMHASALFTLGRSIFGRTKHFSAGIKRNLSGSFERSKIVSFFDLFSEKLLEKSLRYYGVMTFFFAVFFIAFATIREITRFGVVRFFEYNSMNYATIGVVVLVISLILLSSSKSVASQLTESKFFSYLLFDILCCNRKRIESIEPITRSHTAPIIIGMVFSIICVFISPIIMLKILLFTLLAVSVMKAPENGVVLVFLLTPFLDKRVLMFCVLLTLFSYFVKVIRNKRVMKFGLFDVMCALLCAVILLSGVIGVGQSNSLLNALTILLCVVFGFVISNIIKTSELVSKCINALILSTSVIAFIGIVMFFLEKNNIVTLNAFTKSIADILSSIPFASQNLYSELVVMIIPFVFAKYACSSGSSKTSSLVSLALLCAFSVITFDFEIWIFAIVAICAYLCINRPKLIIPVGVVVFILSALNFFTPSVFEYTGRLIASVTGFTYEKYSYLAAWDIISKFDFSGIGSGNAVLEYVLFCTFGAGYERIFGNLTFALSFIMQYGIVGCITAFATIVSFMSHGACFYYINNGCNISQKPYVAASMAVIVAYAVKSIAFSAFLSFEALLCVCMIIYLPFSIKKSAVAEFVPESYDLMYYDENNL